jgi:hypothetical protein
MSEQVWYKKRCYQCACYERVDDLYSEKDDDWKDRSCCCLNPYEPDQRHPFRKVCYMYVKPDSEPL